MKRVLFVDDESKILRGLQRTLRPMHGEWDMFFARSGHEALALFEEHPFDVVVSDMRMPDMAGDEFLTAVRERYPQTVRLILSGFAEVARAQRALNVAHQFLAKPCDVRDLHGAIRRCLALSDLLGGSDLLRLAGGANTIPPAPRVFSELQAALSDPDVPFAEISEIIEREPATAAKVLQIVNSAFYGLARPLISIGEAVRNLGYDKTCNLVLDMALRQAFPSELADELQPHAALCSQLAAELVSDPEDKKVARCAGLVHDVGMVILATRGAEYAELLSLAEASDEPLHAWERRTLGVTHAEIGAYVLGLWGLPAQILEAVALHHEPSRDSGTHFGPVGAVHVAAALTRDVDDLSNIDWTYLERVGVAAEIDGWRAAAATLGRARAY